MANAPGEPNNRGKGPTIAPPPPERRRPKWLIWAALALALLLLLLLFRSCGDREDEAVVAPAPVDSAATLPATGASPPTVGNAAPLAAQLEQYLASAEPAGRRFTFDTLHFATASAELPADAQASIASLAQALTRHPAARIQIVGYADARGAENANAQLGAQRAEAVARALIGAGVAPNRVSATSGSESNPVASNAAAQGQAANRRTEFVISAK